MDKMTLAVVAKLDSFVQFISLLIVFILVCLLSSFTAKYIAKLQKGKVSSGNMEVIEAFRIGAGQYVQIMRIGKKYVAMAVCKDTITVLTELEEGELVLSEVDENMPETLFSKTSFKEFLEKAKRKADKDEES